MLFETMKAYLSSRRLTADDYYPIKAIVVDFDGDGLQVSDDGDTTVQLCGDGWLSAARWQMEVCRADVGGGLQVGLEKWRFVTVEGRSGEWTVGVMPEVYKFSTASPEEVKLIRSAKEKELLTPMVSHEDVKYYILIQDLSRS